MAGALGLKGWEERQSADIATLAAIQSDTRAIAARIEGRVDTAYAVMRLVSETGAVRSAIAAATPGIDAVLTVRDANQSPAGSRLSEAARTATALLEKNDRFGISSQGDIVLVSKPKTGPPMMAIAPSGTWLPAEESGRKISLVSSEGTDLGRPGLSMAGGMKRIATACTPLNGSQAALCESILHPLFTVDDLIRLLIFALLLAAPVLAIVGLMNRLSHEETATIIEETRDDEADRIMGLVMRGARAGYWEWAPGASSVYLSEGASELFGMEDAGLVDAREMLLHVHPEHKARMIETLEKSREMGWIQTSFLTVSQPPLWIEMRGSISNDPKGQPTLFGGIVLDITERKQSEDRVKAAERRLRAAIEGFAGPFALWDHRKRLLYWNRAFALDFGLRDTLRPGIVHDTVVIARAGAVRSEKQSAEDPRTILIELQSNRWLKVVERPTPEGGLITVGIDVTENVENEEELRRQKQTMRKTVLDLERSEGRAGELARRYSEEKSKAEHAAHTKSAFLANMSHELRTPLNAINGFSEILAHELYGPLGDTRYKGYAHDILTSGQHLLDMINDILDMAKIEAGKMTINPQPIDPVDPVDAAVRMIRRKAEDKGIEIVLDAQPGLPDLDADHRAIRQMVLNLLSNAIKFTDAGGKIIATVEQRGTDIYIGVTDTGIGIPIEDLPRLAKPFEQVSGSRDRNYEGTGLGLALTKSFAEMHGGQLTLSSIEGEGTTVAILLPISGASELAAVDDSREVA
jgi:two-component system cell cycle sensor histidine kinase PleC